MHKNDLIIKRNVTVYKIKMGEFIYICFICWLFFQKRIFWCTVNNQDVDSVYGKIVGKFLLWEICIIYSLIKLSLWLLFKNIIYFFFIEKIFINNILYIKKKRQSLKNIRTKLFFLSFLNSNSNSYNKKRQPKFRYN